MKIVTSNDWYDKWIIYVIKQYSAYKILQVQFIWWWCTDLKHSNIYIKEGTYLSVCPDISKLKFATMEFMTSNNQYAK